MIRTLLFFVVAGPPIGALAVVAWEAARPVQPPWDLGSLSGFLAFALFGCYFLGALPALIIGALVGVVRTRIDNAILNGMAGAAGGAIVSGTIPALGALRYVQKYDWTFAQGFAVQGDYAGPVLVASIASGCVCGLLVQWLSGKRKSLDKS